MTSGLFHLLIGSVEELIRGRKHTNNDNKNVFAKKFVFANIINVSYKFHIIQ